MFPGMFVSEHATETAIIHPSQRSFKEGYFAIFAGNLHRSRKRPFFCAKETKIRTFGYFRAPEFRMVQILISM